MERNMEPLFLLTATVIAAKNIPRCAIVKTLEARADE